jgi:hypothetical protein
MGMVTPLEKEPNSGLGTIISPEVRHEIAPGVWLCWDAKVVLNQRGIKFREALRAKGDALLDQLAKDLKESSV